MTVLTAVAIVLGLTLALVGGILAAERALDPVLALLNAPFHRLKAKVLGHPWARLPASTSLTWTWPWYSAHPRLLGQVSATDPALVGSSYAVTVSCERAMSGRLASSRSQVGRVCTTIEIQPRWPLQGGFYARPAGLMPRPPSAMLLSRVDRRPEGIELWAARPPATTGALGKLDASLWEVLRPGLPPSRLHDREGLVLCCPHQLPPDQLERTLARAIALVEALDAGVEGPWRRLADRWGLELDTSGTWPRLSGTVPSGTLRAEIHRRVEVVVQFDHRASGTGALLVPAGEGARPGNPVLDALVAAPAGAEAVLPLLRDGAFSATVMAALAPASTWRVHQEGIQVRVAGDRHDLVEDLVEAVIALSAGLEPLWSLRRAKGAAWPPSS